MWASKTPLAVPPSTLCPQLVPGALEAQPFSRLHAVSLHIAAFGQRAGVSGSPLTKICQDDTFSRERKYVVPLSSASSSQLRPASETVPSTVTEPTDWALMVRLDTPITRAIDSW